MIYNTGLTVYRMIPHFSFKIPKSGLTSAVSSHLVGDAYVQLLSSYLAMLLINYICIFLIYKLKLHPYFLLRGVKRIYDCLHTQQLGICLYALVTVT